MTITAKFASTCPTCGGSIQPGQKVEWSKGEKARHADCGAAKSAPTSSQPHQPVQRTFRPTKCRVCGHVAREDSRGYPVGDKILRSGECQSCYEERKMGY